jgi:DNA mismatch repair protein MutL
VPHDWNKLYDGFMHESVATTPAQASTESHSDLQLNVAQEGVPPLCLQHDHRYIVAPSREGLLIIDQHRAHVKILYEQFMKSATLGQGALQRVMFGEELHLDTAQQAILETVKDELQLMGITLQPQGDCWVITSLPPTISGQDGKDAVLHILDALNVDSESYGSETPDVDTLRSRVALAMARSGALRRGQALSAVEMEKIISDLFKLPDTNVGPDGLPIMCVIDNDKLYKFFN